MPKVGKDKFPYTSAGVQKAQKHAKATGQKVDMSGYKKGGVTKQQRASLSDRIVKSRIKKGFKGKLTDQMKKDLTKRAKDEIRKNPKKVRESISKYYSERKKGGAVKKKYHHGGRVMGGQKKPKKC